MREYCDDCGRYALYPEHRESDHTDFFCDDDQSDDHGEEQPEDGTE